jgi:two-component system, chemotaxis family, CheB/CheR fusion protein
LTIRNNMQTKPRKIPKDKTAESTSVSNEVQFPIVCIGASAGGLEALEQFLSNVPEKSGIAYVVIQHLDPTQKGMLPELLQRITKMEVFQVKDKMAAIPNCVYVIPPNKSMSILNGKLYLFEPIESRGLRLPIDFFMRSLADDKQELAIGVILSGMGSDGSLGIRAIKEKNGIVLVQEPGTAKYDNMPRNAIDSIRVDIIAPAADLPAKLIDLYKQFPVIISNSDIEIKDHSSLEKIIILIRIRTGNDFSLYKRNTLYRRIERRMGIHKIDKISGYVRFLQDNPKEVDILFKELLIGVTSFFRDPLVWKKLKETIMPEIFSNTMAEKVLRAWVPGCSTGEEAYSLAIIFKEAIEKINPYGGFSLQIFATDLDAESIELARKGVYPVNIAADISPTRLNRFFIPIDEGYRINAEIREMVVFAKHNLIMHPPFTKIDFLSCRNLLIYMDVELQKKLLGLFFYSLNPEGTMILGSSETLGTHGYLFTPIDSKLKIFKRGMNKTLPELLDFPSSFSRTKTVYNEKPMTSNSTPNIQSLADQLLLQHFTPAGVLVNQNGDIIYFSGHTGKYLEPSVGKANLNIFAMLREGLRNEFSSGFRKAIMYKESIIIPNLKLGVNGHTLTLNLNIQWIEKPQPLKGMLMIIFDDVSEIVSQKQIPKIVKKGSESINQSILEEELQHLREEMQGTLEEMQTSQEELKSTNEELQSTNEELQSTNEELTTSKEEMQSLNEELQTVNAELQSKVDDYTRVNNDLKNLLNSTDIATLFLDKDLNIRRYTDEATKIFKLIKSDIGRPFTDLVSDLIYPELATDALEVLRTLIFIEKQIPTKDERWFTIRIMPYRTFDDRIDGLVITFINMSNLRLTEVKLFEKEQIHRMLLNSSSDIIIRLSTDFKILEFSAEAERFFGRKFADVKNQNYFHLFVPDSIQIKNEKYLNILLKDAIQGKVKMQVKASEGKTPIVEWSVNLLFNNLNIPNGIILITKI